MGSLPPIIDALTWSEFIERVHARIVDGGRKYTTPTRNFAPPTRKLKSSREAMALLDDAKNLLAVLLGVVRSWKWRR